LTSYAAFLFTPLVTLDRIEDHRFCKGPDKL